MRIPSSEICDLGGDITALSERKEASAQGLVAQAQSGKFKAVALKRANMAMPCFLSPRQRDSYIRWP